MSDNTLTLESKNIPTENELNAMSRIEVAALLRNMSIKKTDYDNIQEKKDYVDNYSDLKALFLSLFEGCYSGLLYGFIPLGIISFLVIHNIYSEDTPVVQMQITSYLTVFLALIVGIIIGFFYHKTGQKKFAESKTEVEQYYNSTEWLQERELFLNKLTVILGPNYQSPAIIETFSSYFNNGRCSTLQEAKNLYENELAQQAMNQKIEQAVSEAQKATAAAKKASSKAGTATAISVFNMFRK